VNAAAARPKQSLWPKTSGVSMPISRTLPIPLSQSVSPSVLRVTIAACVELDAVSSGCELAHPARATVAPTAAMAVVT
jgi:hypothetical protein